MDFQRYGRLAGVAFVGALALAACGTNENTSTGGATAGGTAGGLGVECAKGTINSSGSTAQANAMTEWRTAYQKACSGSTINYQPNGSGAGIEQFVQGSTAFAGSDSALKPEEQQQATKRCNGNPALDLPMVVGPIAIVYNLPGVDGLQMSPTVLAQIFSGKIKTWNDPAIKKDNPNAQLPSAPIQAIHRSDASGTTDNFTKFLKATAPSVWTFEPGKQWVAPGGQGAKGSDGVSQVVKQTQGAISYVEYSYATNAQLQMAKVANGAGEFVALTPDSASKGVESAQQVGQGNDLALKIDYATKAAGAYPLVLVTYEITCEKGLPTDQLALVKSFLSYTASQKGQAGLTKLGYAPLPQSLATKVQQVVKGLS